MCEGLYRFQFSFDCDSHKHVRHYIGAYMHSQVQNTLLTAKLR